jgi:tetratricopeptide (TPR) repeat protein/tRNA A-37 threonylcarbamoyl transferase component Bud32
MLTVDEALPASQAVHVDQVCDRFEAAWKDAGTDGAPPRIEEFLEKTPEPERSLLLHQMLLLEVDYRRLRGETPAPEEYERRFSALPARLLAEAFPLPAPGEPNDVVVTVPASPVAPQARTRRYVARQFHARGGIGEVWLADDPEIGRPVALKRLRKKLEGQQERFLVEAQVTGQLEHPGIVPVHDMGIDEEGRPFYVMTFIRGRTLKDVIEEYHSGRSASKEAPEVQQCRLLEVFVKVCEAVAYAHNRGVIHRDLKPDNIMLGPFGETLVVDWGMAKVRSQNEQPGGSDPVQLTYTSGSTKTQAGSIMGSPFYMAPEMAEGRSNDANERTDVYLLGGTLYHLLTNHPPREGRTLDEIIELARNSNPTPPRKLKTDVPRALDAICCKAMARKPADRYSNALELADDVRRYLVGAPVSAHPEPLSVRAWRWCKRHRRILGRSLITVVVLGVALFATIRVRERLAEAENRQKADREAREKSEQKATQLNRREKVRRDLVEFRHLIDERQFHAASTTAAGDRPLSYGARQAQEAGEKALALADGISAEFDELVNDVSVIEENAAFKKQLHDLLLLMVQSQSDQSPAPAVVQAMLQRLERAATLQKPSRGYYRLRARCFQMLGDMHQCDEETRRSDDPNLAATALDHFLLGEQARNEANLPVAGQADPTAWQANPERVARAIEHYQASLRLEPDHYWCNYMLGWCFFDLNKGSEAVQTFGTCVALQPTLPWGYTARGQALAGIRRFADAEKDLETALSLDKDFAPALLNRGSLSWQQGKRDQALANFSKVLDLPAERRSARAAYYRGLMLVERGKFRDGLADFDTVVRETPDFRPVYISRAQVYFLQDDPRGIADLTTFLELGRPGPGEHVLFALRGHMLCQLAPGWGLTAQQGRAALMLARDQLNRAISLGGRSADVLHDLGAVHELLGEPEKALDFYAQALDAKPSRALEVKIHSKRGWLLAQSSEPDRARESFAAILRLEPNSADARAGLGYVAARSKAPTEAQREAAQSLLNGAGDYLMLHNTACVYAELSRSEKDQKKQHEDVAIALLQRAVELWRRDGVGPDEIDLIRRDPSFDSFRDRLKFDRLPGQ